MEKISVIVPVYNGEQYIEQCINSISAQTYTNLEIIIINDGSTDSTAARIQNLVQKDERIRVLHKEKNEGIGMARNSGLAMASGEYIVFVDSDDWIDTNHVQNLYDLLKRTSSDVAIANFTEYEDETGKYIIHIGENDYYEAVYTPQEWFAFQYGKPHHLSQCFTVPWVKIYKKSLFDNITYWTGGFGEDDRTTWKTYIVADRIAYMHQSSYVYRKNDTSVTQTTQLATVFSVEPVLERLATLSLLGWDVSDEVKAFKWRAQINRSHYLQTGNMTAYKALNLQLKLIEKYEK